MIFHGRMEVFSNFLSLTVIFMGTLSCCLLASSWACKARSQKLWIWYKHSYSPQTLSLQPSKQLN